MFEEFITDNDEMVSRKAKQLETLFVQVEVDIISASEFEELSGDILDLERITAHMDDVVHEAYLEKAFDLMKIIVKTVLKGL